MVKQR